MKQKNIDETIRDARDVVDIAKEVCGYVADLQKERQIGMAKLSLVMATATYIMLRSRYSSQFEAMKQYNEVGAIGGELIEQLIRSQRGSKIPG